MEGAVLVCTLEGTSSTPSARVCCTRSKDTQELVITTDYAAAFHARSHENASERLRDNPSDFRVVIPRSEIVSARLFDPDLHQQFQAAGN